MTEEAQKVLDELNTVRIEVLNDEAKRLFEAIMKIANERDKLKEELDFLKEEKEQAWEEWNNLEQGSYETEQRLKMEKKELEHKLNNKVLFVRDDTTKMYEQNEIKLESRITELENVIIQAIDELKNINFYEPRLKNKNQKEFNKAYSMLFDALKTKES